MLIGVSCRTYPWRDVEEAVARCADEFGLDLLEFDAARLTPEEYPELGLLGQRYGISLSLRVCPWPMEPVELEALRERCEEGLIRHLVLAPGSGPIDFAHAEHALTEVAPAYVASGIVLCVECGVLDERLAAWRDLCAAVGSEAVRVCLTVEAGQQVSGVLVPGALARHVGYVRVVDLTPQSLPGFRGPYVLALPAPVDAGRFAAMIAAVRQALTSSSPHPITGAASGCPPLPRARRTGRRSPPA